MKTTPISENLKKMLEDRGYKQKYLANQLNTSDRVISNILNGRKSLDEPLIIKLAQVMDVDFNTLFGYRK